MSNFTPEQIQEILDLYFENFAHRQYIGARYVPIFGRKDETTIEWDNSAPYEPLTIVLHEGNSYTSRQFVPEGVAITNTAYWAETGNFNAQVEQYRQEVIGLLDVLPISDFSAENTVSAALTQNANATAAVDAKLGTGFSSENTVKDYIDDTVSRKAIYIGNSYTDGYGATGKGLFYFTRHLFADSWKFTGPGSGFVFGDYPFPALLQSAASSADFDNEEITDIIFICAAGEMVSFASTYSYNAANYISAVNAAITQLKTYIETNFPNVKRVVCTLAEAQQYPVCFTSNTYIPYFVTMLINQALNGLCNKHGFEYLGWLGWEVTCEPDLFYDTIHPVEDGYKILANAFLNAWNGEYAPTRFHNRLELSGMMTTQSSSMITFTTEPDGTGLIVNSLASNKDQGVTPTSTADWNDLFTIGTNNAVNNKVLIPPIIKPSAVTNFEIQKFVNAFINCDITSATHILPLYLRLKYDTSGHSIKVQYRIWKDIPDSAGSYTSEMALYPSSMVVPCIGMV